MIMAKFIRNLASSRRLRLLGRLQKKYEGK